MCWRGNSRAMTWVDRLDRYQRIHSWIGFPLAVAYKAFDDRAPYLAALVTYYAFVSLFPLMLLFLSVTGFVLDSHAGLRRDLVASALKQFPVIGGQLKTSIRHFQGSGPAVALGVVGTLYGALGATQAAQAAFNQIYGVPRHEQPNPLWSRLRSLGLLALLGTALVASTGVGALVATSNSVSRQLGAGLHVLAYVLTLAINIALFTAAFQLLTARDLRIRNVLTGGVVAGGAWEMLQTFGPRLIAHEATHGASLYGVFGTVLASIAWIYLQALVLMLAAEINVVRHFRLWPRSLLTPFTDDVELTSADQRAYDLYAHAQRFKGTQTVLTRYEVARGR